MGAAEIIVLISFAGGLGIVVLVNWAMRSRKACIDCGDKVIFPGKEEPFVCSTCKLERRLKTEEKRPCPKCGIQMGKKAIMGDIVIDKCPSCNGVWLDAGELEKIRDRESSDGHSSGIMLGMAIG